MTCCSHADTSPTMRRFADLGEADPGHDVLGALALGRLQAQVLGRASDVRVGRYIMGRRLGTGGEGAVYEAEDRLLGRRVALKLLWPHPGARGERAQVRLAHEAKFLAAVNHPNVVQVFDAGTRDGQIYIARELAEGPSLRSWLASPRPWREVLEVLCQAARGLQAVHDAGLVHGDVKPANILLSRGVAKLADFGLSRHFSAASPLADRTPPGVGTPQYMAPEQAVGGAATPATDQYGLALCVWESLFGARRPGTADPEGVLGPVPRSLRRVVHRAMDPDPQRRWRSVRRFEAALQRASRRRTTTRLIAATGVLLVVAGGAAIPSLTAAPAHGPLAAVAPLVLDAPIRAADRRAVARAKDLERQGRFAAAADAWAAVAGAADHDAQPRRAEQARVEQGRLLLALGQADAGRALLQGAHLQATGARWDAIAADAALWLAHDEREHEGHGAQRWLRASVTSAQRTTMPDAYYLDVRMEEAMDLVLHDEWTLAHRAIELVAQHPSAPTTGARARIWLARIDREQGRLQDADLQLNHAETLLGQLGAAHPLWADLWDERGTLDNFAGRTDAARDHYGRALALRIEALGSSHPRTADSFNNLGNLELRFGSSQRARGHFARSRAIWSQAFADGHTKRIAAEINLAVLDFRDGDLERAAAGLEEALASMPSTDVSPRRAGTLTNLGLVQKAAGQCGPAIHTLHAALEAFTRLAGDNAEGRATAQHAAAECHRARGEVSIALELAHQAQRLRHRVAAPAVLTAASDALVRQLQDEARARSNPA